MSAPLPIALHHGDYREVLAGVKADLSFTSPPYNIGSRGLAKRGDNTKRPGYEHRKGNYGRGVKLWSSITGYPDNLPEAEYQDSQAEFLIWCADHLVADGTVAYNHKERHRDITALNPIRWIVRPEVEAKLTLVQTIIWDRGTTHCLDKTYCWPYHELIFVLRRTGGKYRKPRHDRLPAFRSDIWRIPIRAGAR